MSNNENDEGRRSRGSADFLLVFFAMFTGGGIVFLGMAFEAIPFLKFGDNTTLAYAVIVGVFLATFGWVRIFQKSH